MKKYQEFKFYIEFYYLDKCENLQSGYTFIWAKSESQANAILFRNASKKNYAITSINTIEIIDERWCD